MLNNDILLQIFRLCDLESCLALSETCRANRLLWMALDETLVRQKVLERVPWFKLEGTFKYWIQCALVLVKRSNGPLDRFQPNQYLIRSLEVPIYLSNNNAKMEPVEDITEKDEFRKTMTPLFKEPIKCKSSLDHDFETQGTTVVWNKDKSAMEMDLKTMFVKKRTETGRPKRKFSKSTDRDTAPSGVQVRVEHELEAYIEVIDENDNILQVCVYLQKRSRWGAPEDFSWNSNVVAHILVHKESHAKDADGTIVVTPNKDKPSYFSRDYTQQGLVNLLPGSGGALVTRECDGLIEESYLAYVEPKEGLPLVYLFSVPWLSSESCYYYSSCDIKFFVSYHGYFFFYFEGRFVRLWIDLGVKAPLDLCLGDRNLMTYGTDRALVVWNRNVPTIGTFCQHTMRIVTHGISQNGPWVTVTDAQGRCVGNLATGETFFALNWGRGFGELVIPYLAANTVRFTFFRSEVVKKLHDEMRTGKETQLNYKQIREGVPVWETHWGNQEERERLEGEVKDVTRRYNEKKRKPGSEFKYLEKDCKFDERVPKKQYIGTEHVDIYKKRPPPPLNCRTIVDHGVFRGVVNRTLNQHGYCRGWDCEGHKGERQITQREEYRKSWGMTSRSSGRNFLERDVDMKW